MKSSLMLGALAVTAMASQAKASIATSGLVLHYAASDYDPNTGIWTNTGSATGANATAVAGTGAPLPTKVTASDLNNQTAVKFAYTANTDATASRGFTATYATSLFSGNAATAFVVFTPGTGSVYETLWSSGRQDTFTSFNGAAYSGLFRSNRVSSSPSSGMPTSTSTGGFLLETDSSSSGFSLVLNGVTQSTTAAGTTFLAPGTLLIGSNQLPNSTFKGEIAEVLIYNRLLTAQEQQDNNAALASQYGLTVASTPEPTGLSLLGIVGLATLRRRKRA